MFDNQRSRARSPNLAIAPDRKGDVYVGPKTNLYVELMTDVIPHLRETRYPPPKIAALEEMAERFFELDDHVPRGKPKKGALK